MQSNIQVASPPTKPLVIFDGDCTFCGIWIRRWRAISGDKVDYLPFQDSSISARFPELERGLFERAVHLIETDGGVYSGAEAAFRALAYNPHRRWVLGRYQRSPLFARTSERAYRFIASHRGFFSLVTRTLWGRSVQPATFFLVRSVFLRGLALIYLTAFVSLWSQIFGLIGDHGILPAKITMENVGRQVTEASLELDRYHVFPTLCWFSASDASLNLQCAAGTVLAILLFLGIAPAPSLFLLWLIYLSLSTIGREFLSFQWDILLLEVGFLGIFFAPLTYLPWRKPGPPVSRVVLWLIRWLLFRLMFESGCVKLLSGDPTWKNLTALNYHYETQPLPTWIGWYAHQLPAWFQKTSTVLMFLIEIVVPFLIFAPRRLRRFAFVALVMLQAAIVATGNYTFFNLLTILLCLPLLDDAALRTAAGFVRRKFLRSRVEKSESSEEFLPVAPAGVPWLRRSHVVLASLLTALILFLSLFQFIGMFAERAAIPHPALAVMQWLGPFRTFNSYGLFRVMTTSRHEIIVQGSNDGTTWRDYEFKYKPGDPRRRPAFVAPHQPRLDWQMWFAALSRYQHNPWFVQFCASLLRNSPEVVGLLKTNPFPDAPPRYIRAVVYDYHFTDLKTRRQTGEWWRREYLGLYLPPGSLREASGGNLNLIPQAREKL